MLTFPLLLLTVSPARATVAAAAALQHMVISLVRRWPLDDLRLLWQATPPLADSALGMITATRV